MLRVANHRKVILPEFGFARYEQKSGKRRNDERYWKKIITATQRA